MKIIAMIPAEGWWALFKRDSEREPHEAKKVMGFAVVEGGGRVVGLVTNHVGAIMEATDFPFFDSYEYRTVDTELK